MNMKTTTRWCSLGAALGALLMGCSGDGDLIGRGSSGGTAGAGGTGGSTTSSGTGGTSTSSGGTGGTGSDVCHEKADCPAGHVCVYETGVCEPEAAVTCPPTPSTAGTQGLGESCGWAETTGQNTKEYPCAPGLLCVPMEFSLDPTTGEYVPSVASVASKLTGRCLEPCDPCSGTCSAGTCVALKEGGGFCAQGPLVGEGELCALLDEPVAWCEAGTMCRLTGTNQTACVRYCAPDDPAFWEFAGVSAFAKSQDCGAHQACSHTQSSLYQNDVWTCAPADLQTTGGSCNNPDSPTMKCAWPDSCINGYSPELGAVPATCSLVNNPDPEVCPSCPVGTVCRFAGDGSTNTRAACVAPGAVGMFGYCVEDVDCAAALECKVHATAGKICQP